MSDRDDIKAAIELLRERGVKGNLYVVPTTPVHCFAPCWPGQCICSATIGDRYCVVDEAGKKKALEWANLALQELNEIAKECGALEDGDDRT